MCGENGNFQFIEDFGTASYEKDGTIDLVWKNQGPDSDETAGPPKSKTSTLAPADDYGKFVVVIVVACWYSIGSNISCP